ncbi:hypothetical protein [Henriciella sp.]|uniref:hypothetical protein n=1 Tax=Henriciella sp. TaxID=1968823 RepID=UPI002617E583|nr:hypothetical protein [Henriciella sp.]
MWRRTLSGLFCLGIVACETAPPVPTEMEPAAFEQAVGEARDKPHPWSTIQAYTDLLDSGRLSQGQRLEALFARGSARRQARINLPGAVQDLEEAQILAGADSPLIENIATEIEYAKTDWGRAAGKLEGLQTLPEWFNSKVAMGGLPEAAERYRESDLAPSPDQVSLLEAAGYLCRTSGASDETWTVTEEAEHLEGLEWCENPGVS